MNQLRIGTEVRAKSNHAVTGTLRMSYGGSRACHVVTTTWGMAYINDDEIEVVPPEPFTDTLEVGDLMQGFFKQNTCQLTSVLVVRSVYTWTDVVVVRAWKRRGNDYVMVYDADQGGYLESEGAK